MPTAAAITLAGLTLWRALICAVALAPLAYYLVAILATLRFFRREREKRPPAYTPPVSVL